MAKVRRATFTIERAPEWWLRLTIAHLDEADRAANALCGQIARGELDADAGSALLDALASRQANAGLGWSPTIANLTRDAYRAGLFHASPALTHLIAGSLVLAAEPIGPTERPPQGGYVELPRVVVRPARGFPREAIDLEFGLGKCVWLERPTFISRQPGAVMNYGVPDARGVMVQNDLNHLLFYSLADGFQVAVVGPGIHPVAIHLDYSLCLRQGPSDFVLTAEDRSKRPRATVSVDLAGNAHVLPVPDIGPEVDGAAFFAALSLRPNDVESGLHISLDEHGPSFEFTCPPLTIPLAAAVTLRDSAGRVWPMQLLTCKGDGREATQLVWGPMAQEDWRGFDARRVDVIVESNAMIAVYQRVRGPHLVGRRVWADVPVLRRDTPTMLRGRP